MSKVKGPGFEVITFFHAQPNMVNSTSECFKRELISAFQKFSFYA